MSKIVIIGNSAAGFSAAETLTKTTQGLELTVITKDQHPAYRKDLLFDFLSGAVKEEELFCCGLNFYAEHKINFQNKQEVVKLDTKKQRLSLKEGAKIVYDYLILASGCQARLADIPGKTKEGVIVWGGLQQAKQILQRLDIAQTVCLVGEAALCQRLCQALAPRAKELKVISTSPPEGFASDEKLEWMDQLQVNELIGEGAQLQALKLNNGKVIATGLVIFCGKPLAALDFLKESDIQTAEGFVMVDDELRTNLGNVFACGSVCRSKVDLNKDKSWEEAAGEGVLAAEGVLKSLERGKLLCQQTS
jgi:NAD(P)H-nitrite reductase large subunit